MNKSVLFALPLLTSLLFACNSNQSSDTSSSSSSASQETISTVTYEVTLMRHDGNREDTDQVFYYLGVCVFPEYMRDMIDLSTIVVGDSITLTYTGELRILQTYPGQLRISHLISAEITKKAEIVKTSVEGGKIIAPEGISLAEMADGYRAGTAIDDTYHRVDIADMQSGFLSCSALEKGKARSFYTFDPSTKGSPNIAWEGSTRW